MSKYILLILAFLLILPRWAANAKDQYATATNPRFIFPLDCTLNQNCWLLSAVDMDTEKNKVSDYRCFSRSYDGHKGTDFALRSMAEMRTGVNVLAAKDGKAVRTRDSENDFLKTDKQIAEISKQNKDCGNGVMIDHGDELFTQYCHMKKGSLQVKPGDEIKAGDVLGQVGASGNTQMPHLHISVYWHDKIIDPFTGRNPNEGCGDVKSDMWQPSIPYQYATIYDGGFLDKQPNFKAIEDGQPSLTEIKSSSDALLFWAAFLGVEEGDKISMRVLTGDGKTALKRDLIQDKTRARQYYTLGRKFEDRLIPAGTYTGIAELKRKGYPDLRQSFAVKVF